MVLMMVVVFFRHVCECLFHVGLTRTTKTFDLTEAVESQDNPFGRIPIKGRRPCTEVLRESMLFCSRELEAYVSLMFYLHAVVRWSESHCSRE